MIVIPQRLLDSSNVQLILAENQNYILHKQLSKAVIGREGYINKHAIVLILEGKQQIETYEKESIFLSKNQLLFLPRGLYRVTDLLPTSGSFSCLLFYFDEEILQKFLTINPISNPFDTTRSTPCYLKTNTNSHIDAFGENLINNYSSIPNPSSPLLSIKILELLQLLQQLQKDKHLLPRFIFELTRPKQRDIKSFMLHNYTKILKVEDYAYLTGRSISTFRRDFKAHFDTTPQQWLQSKRLEKALELIHQNNISVTQLAYEVGYDNISYFIKTFKKHIGLSPKQYSLQLQQEN